MNYTIREELPGIWLIDLKVEDRNEYTCAYLLVRGGDAALVEVGPASTYQRIIDALNEIGVQLKNVRFIFVTHVHLDHAGAAGSLLKHFPRAEIVAHKRGVDHLSDPERVLWKASKKVLGSVADIYGKPEPVPENRITSINSRERFAVSGLSIDIIPTPGHASHHVCIYLEEKGVIFSGDSAGIFVPCLDVVLPISPPPFILKLALQSVKVMLDLQPGIIGYTHYGFSKDAIRRLNRYSRQLSVWYECTKELLSRGTRDSDEILKFISTRDRDLSIFLQSSEEVEVIKRTMNSCLDGFIQLVDQENKEIPVFD